MVNYERYFREGKKRTDVTPAFANPAVFKQMVDDLAGRCTIPCTKVAGIEALGFILGSALAERKGVGFVPIRKSYAPDAVSFVDYSGEHKALRIEPGLLENGDRVLIVDDWIETGAQMRAASTLIERAGASVAGLAVLSAERTERTRTLFAKYPVVALVVKGDG